MTAPLFIVYLAAASGRSSALPCFAAVSALVRFHAYTVILQTRSLRDIPSFTRISWGNFIPADLDALPGRIVQDASLAQHRTYPLSNHVILCAKLERCKQACGKAISRKLCGVTLTISPYFFRFVQYPLQH